MRICTTFALSAGRINSPWQIKGSAFPEAVNRRVVSRTGHAKYCSGPFPYQWWLWALNPQTWRSASSAVLVAAGEVGFGTTVAVGAAVDGAVSGAFAEGEVGAAAIVALGSVAPFDWKGKAKGTTNDRKQKPNTNRRPAQVRDCMGFLIRDCRWPVLVPSYEYLGGSRQEDLFDELSYSQHCSEPSPHRVVQLARSSTEPPRAGL